MTIREDGSFEFTGTPVAKETIVIVAPINVWNAMANPAS